MRRIEHAESGRRAPRGIGLRARGGVKARGYRGSNITRRDCHGTFVKALISENTCDLNLL